MKNSSRWLLWSVAALALLVVGGLYSQDVAAPDLLVIPEAASGWVRQFGSEYDSGHGLTEASGVSVADQVYVVGWTYGTLPGQTNVGRSDAWVRTYDRNGKEMWTRQFGTGYDSYDGASGVSATTEGVYVVGDVGDALPGQISAGLSDAYVRKYDRSGNELWTDQYGSSVYDDARGVSTTVEGVYVVGRTVGTLPGQISAGNDDAYVRKYDHHGNVLWTRQFGTSSWDIGLGVSATAEGVYVTGLTHGTLPGQISAGDEDAFVRKYDHDGNVLWTRQFGSTKNDSAGGVSATVEGLYVVGNAAGALPGQIHRGSFDGFVRKYDLNGSELWTHQFGTPERDSVLGVSATAEGVYAVGTTAGALPAQVSGGEYDGFLVRYDLAGNLLRVHQFGRVESDNVHAVSAFPGGVSMAGESGSYRVFVTRHTL